MSEVPAGAESPQLVRNRLTALGAAAIVCLALPTVALLVLDAPGEGRRTSAIWLGAGAIGGALVPFVYYAPYRALGIAPLASVAWLAAAAHGAYWHEWPAWAHGAPLGLVVGALARGRRGTEPAAEAAMPFAFTLVGAWIAYA